MANEEVLELQIRDNAGDAATALDRLATALGNVKDAIGKGLRMKGVANQLETLKRAVNEGLNEESVAKFERLAQVLGELKSIGALKITGIKNIADQLNISDSLAQAREEAAQTGNDISNAVNGGMETVGSRAMTTGQTIKNALASASDKVRELWNRLRDVIHASNEKGGSLFDSLKGGIKGVLGNIRKLIGDFARIVKYRAIRSVIKQITEAFSTGVKNVYGYSKAIGSSFAPAMNDAASVLLQFKNSIGAAVAPLIESLIPVMKLVVNGVIEAINYLNQFIAMLRGQSSWTKALYKPVEAFEDQAKKAKGAKKAVNELLADWDELNIIQSESGGGSGGAAEAVEDYTKMFEQETKFDNWLGDHFRDILTYAGLIGTALAGWKLSKAFTGILNKLFRLVAGGALVALGVKLSFDSAFDAGLNGFSTGNVLGMIGGALAAGLGGYLIASMTPLGGAWGLAIGITVGIVASLIGYVEGRRSLRDKNKWGNLSMTQEEIREFVADQFSFDAKAEITVLNGGIANSREARRQLNKDIDDFKDSLHDANVQAEINIDSDETSTAVVNAANDARKAITSIENLINKSNDGLNILIKTFGFTDADGNDISSDLINSISIADQTVSNYFRGIGDELAGLIEQGEHEHWQNADTKQAALDLMERERKILDEAAKMKADLQLDTTIRGGMKNVVDRTTALAVLEEQKKALDEYRVAAETAYAEQADNWDELSALAFAAAKDARSIGTTEALKKAAELEDAANTYHNKAIEIMNNSGEEIDKKLAETRKKMAEDWAKTLQVVYGEDFTKVVQRYMTKVSSLDYRDSNLVQKLIKGGHYKEAGEELKKALIQELTSGNVDPNGVISYVLNDLQGDVFSLLDEDTRKIIGDNLITALKRNGAWEGKAITGDKFVSITQEEIKDILKEAFNLSDDEISKLMPEYNLKPDIEMEPNFTYKDAEGKLESALDIGKALFTMGTGALMNPFANANRYSTETPGAGNGSDNTEMYEKLTENTGKTASETETQTAILRTIESLARTISNKDWILNVTPNSGWGAHNARSNAAYERVTGTGGGMGTMQAMIK